MSDRHNLAIFDLVVLLQCKFQLKSPNGSGGEVKQWFVRWRLCLPFWISNKHDFS